MPTSASGEGTLRWIPTEEAIEVEAEGATSTSQGCPPTAALWGARHRLMRSQPCGPLTLDSGSRTTQDDPLLG